MDSQNLKDKVNDNYLGISGAIWCVLAGLCYGTMNVFAKMAYNKGLLVSRFVIMRFLMLGLCSYAYGRLFRNVDFNLTKYPVKLILMVFFRSTMSMLSKSMQFAAIAYIPLTMSSCISFTTGPLIAALLAFIMIREKLNLQEASAITLGILGTMMLTMPQWFLWMNIDSDEIQKRLGKELKEYDHYFLGIVLALGSSALDQCTYYIIRFIGEGIPKSLFPFISGIYTTTILLVYTQVTQPLDFGFFLRPAAADPEHAFADQEYKQAILLSLVGCTFGWIALEFMIIGLRISKSAVASYGEMAGLTIPFLCDAFIFGRQFLAIDALGVVLIIGVQGFLAVQK